VQSGQQFKMFFAFHGPVGTAAFVEVAMVAEAKHIPFLPRNLAVPSAQNMVCLGGEAATI